MIIDFKSVPETTHKNFNGGEKSTILKIFNDDKNKIMYGKLESSASIGLHKHENNSEILYVLKGNGKVLYNGEYEKVSEGICHYCPKGDSHSLINDSENDLIFFAVVPQQ
ncbi:MAG: cupin domain-containing protein [Oscillospiraceae bacterium]